MELPDSKKLHGSLEFIGMRTQATAAGLVQLCRELLDVGILDTDAVHRIRDAIVSDIALSCPRSMSREEYEAMVRERLDNVLAPRGVQDAPAALQ
ncbi:hypothetical protein [Stakelama saccharophila]|uniref:Uncharacterized protein n=1 Tax=Stakelama saccharophila TaxID=3075605 RepID=A0ABZ0BAA8_9SPHN|nr:hypothetical protein [Stakelama sp. W311]WNO54350.1 hypothetical protein RPR59_03585 [Stakelama sp. W311]